MTTFEKVKKIVVEKLGVSEDKVTETATFVNDLGADSLDVVEFVMEVEKNLTSQFQMMQQQNWKKLAMLLNTSTNTRKTNSCFC